MWLKVCNRFGFSHLKMTSFEIILRNVLYHRINQVPQVESAAIYRHFNEIGFYENQVKFESKINEMQLM